MDWPFNKGAYLGEHRLQLMSFNLPPNLREAIKQAVREWHQSWGHAYPHEATQTGIPSDTVVEETSHGQIATAGSDSKFSRGGHSHGTPSTHLDLDDIGRFDHDEIDSHFEIFNGLIEESFTFTITESGGNIIGTLDRNPTGNLTEMFSDAHTTFESGGTVTLTAGTAAVPKKNYIYILQSNKGVLVASDSDWPVTEHIKVAEVVVQTAAIVAADGILANRFWNDHIKGGPNDAVPNQGHLSHAWERLRWEHSSYRSGSAVTWSGSGTGALDLAISAGKTYQLHLQNVSAFDTTDPGEVLVPNQHVNNGGNYDATADIETLVNDSEDVSLSNKYYNLVIWCSVSSGSEEEKVFINLPSGSYTTQIGATNDTSGFDNFGIPIGFKGYAYLIQRVTIKHAPGGPTWTIIEELDLRGQIPNIIAGGGAAAITTEFVDSAFRVFDDGDPTRQIALQASDITPGQTRVITVPDENVTLHNEHPHSIPFIVNGGGSEIAVGIHGDIRVDYACTIVAVTMLADQSGSIVVDIWKQAYADYPPENANSITAAAVPTINADTDSEDDTLAGWTTAISAGDTLRYNVDSVTDLERVTVSLEVTVP